MSKIRHVRRLWPIVLMGYERWQKLPQHKKDAYAKQARDYAGKGRKALSSRGGKKKS